MPFDAEIFESLGPLHGRSLCPWEELPAPVPSFFRVHTVTRHAEHLGVCSSSSSSQEKAK